MSQVPTSMPAPEEILLGKPVAQFETIIDVPFTVAWKMIREWGGWAKWSPILKSQGIINGIEGVGSIKRSVMASSGYACENILTVIDDDIHRLRYDFVGSNPPLPGDVTATTGIDCEEVGDNQTKIIWVLWSRIEGPSEEFKSDFYAKIEKSYVIHFENLVKFVNSQ